jgi:DNA (cytosine-5)-methyltransferase 1
MSKPRLLDLCCKAGGCSYGYNLAGFDVTGIDIEPQPNYPFKFIQADVLTFDLSGYDAYHCSPPCQRYTRLQATRPENRDNHPDIVDAIRQRLAETGRPYVIENVIGAPVERSIMLCGTMFGLRVIRHRLFESNVLLLQPGHIDQCRKRQLKVAKTSCIAKEDEYWSIAGHFGQRDQAQRAMGIDWMRTQAEIANAIPPAYTHWIGELLLQYCEVCV